MAKRLGWVLVLTGIAAAAAVGPALASGPDRVDAQCRATFGSRNDGICLDGPTIPPPDFPFLNLGPTNGAGPGITSGPLFPGQTIGGSVPLG
jgi:hypothetical protein